MSNLVRDDLYFPIPVCTVSPTCSSDIVFLLPLPRLNLAVAGKHDDFFDDDVGHG